MIADADGLEVDETTHIQAALWCSRENIFKFRWAFMTSGCPFLAGPSAQRNVNRAYLE
jgi:hypothetical protein